MEEIQIDDRLRKVFKAVVKQTEALMSLYEGGQEDIQDLVKDHLNSRYSFREDGMINAANIPIKFEFDELFEWVNTKPRKTLDHVAASNVIIFDFFTHCCIDCIHSIEDLRQAHLHIQDLRSKQEKDEEDPGFKCGFKIMSIHSPKFTTERESESILNSVERMKMHHTEVINDPERVLWRQFGLHVWPTIMIFGPNVNREHPGPNLLFAFTLDGHRKFLKYISEALVTYFDRRLTTEQVTGFETQIKENEDSEGVRSESSQGLEKTPVRASATSFLNFPGKVTVFGNAVAISDTGNSRIIISNLAGNIQHIVGGPEGGFQDGDFSAARFYNPQGIAFRNDEVFYVADQGNHSIREVNLVTKEVTTLVPPEHPVLHLKSPWDVTLYSPDVLLIAGARTHQIFGYFFSATTLFGVEHEEGATDLVAGSGFEENRNDENDLLASSYSQPSGLVCTGTESEGNRTLYIADSESSSIRSISAEGKALPVVGASEDPYNLFVYGDQDGFGYEVRLQHPMGVAAVGESTLYITDTYNHKIKKINLETKECTSVLGSGRPGNQVGGFGGTKLKPALLNEPAGLCIDSSNDFLFIADTNNHSIKVAHLKSSLVSEFILNVPTPITPSSDKDYVLAIGRNTQKASINLGICGVPESTEGGSWKVVAPIFGVKPIANGSFSFNSSQLKQEATIENIPTVPWLREAFILVSVAYCKAGGCHLREFKLRLQLQYKDDVESAGESNSHAIDFSTPPGVFE